MNSEMAQKQLAERVSVSRQTMNAIESCRYTPMLDVSIRIADVFDITVDQLFDLDYEGRPAHREQVTKVAVDRSEAAEVEPVEIDAGFEPAETGAERPTRMTDLGRIVDS